MGRPALRKEGEISVVRVLGFAPWGPSLGWPTAAPVDNSVDLAQHRNLGLKVAESGLHVNVVDTGAAALDGQRAVVRGRGVRLKDDVEPAGPDVIEGDAGASPCRRLLEKEEIKEFYLGIKESGVRGNRRWKKKKLWR